MSEVNILKHPEFIQAVQLIQSDSFTEASRLLERLLEVHPTNTSIMYNLAVCHSQTGTYDVAAVLFEKVLEAEPNFAIAYINFGKMEYLRGNHDEGLALFEGACKIEPENQDARIARAMGYHSCGRISDALQEFEEIVNREDGSEVAVHFYISCLVQLQYFSRALKTIEELDAKGMISSELNEVKEMCVQHLDFDQDSIKQGEQEQEQSRVIFQHAL
ncbi:tetratricopeptide repeat protein [Vibrio sp. HN007]|uniref:tetratricopeptide repeat protein n=1 Tax=Vibrio iocasae TaxID=3098914 RepID=UPI0035D4C3C9